LLLDVPSRVPLYLILHGDDGGLAHELPKRKKKEIRQAIL
jgi:hypothetical protein